MFDQNQNSYAAAEKLNANDPLKKFREEFAFPKTKDGRECLYFAGHSLGLRPRKAVEYINDELKDWETYGVEGHFEGRFPWLPYHENITASYAKLVGAKKSEVISMNTLTVNLHLMLVSFYRPRKTRYKILIENTTFPSDQYAVSSQARMHGFDYKDAVVELKPREGELIVRDEDIVAQIEELGDSLATVMLGNCNYLTGQYFDMEKITKAAHKAGAYCGFNMAHGAGNIATKLHDWNVDFAVWCNYKYLNSGPGGLAGAYVHEKHHQNPEIPRLEGWWGHNKETRFQMPKEFDPIPTAEAWQVSNPPIFQLAALRASMELYDEATMDALMEKSKNLTGYFEFLLKENCSDLLDVITPERRGSMLCLRMKNDPKKLVQTFGKEGAILDFREPDIIRAAPIPLYTNYTDVYKLVELIKTHA